MIVHGLIAVGLLICAIQAVRAQRLLLSALWLAGASALTALMIYLLGAPEVAVIELSVGAGLVTVLFVFAINIAGEEPISTISIVPKPLAWFLTLVSIFMLIYLNRDLVGIPVNILAPLGSQFNEVLWENRVLDVLLQMVMVFCGVMGVLGLLAEINPAVAGEKTR
jgi:uncharacterized MnhB-related membrane protein